MSRDWVAVVADMLLIFGGLCIGLGPWLLGLALVAAGGGMRGWADDRAESATWLAAVDDIAGERRQS